MRLSVLWNFFIDFVFPPSSEELLLRELTTEEIFHKLPTAPATPFPFITSVFAYKNELVSKLIWNIKYKKDAHAVELGGFALYEKLKRENLESIVLIPIPISRKRRKERGYNQCELLVNEIIKLDRENKFRKDFDLLVRTKHTERQTLKNRKERIEGAESVFSVNKSDLERTTPLVIIDDVTTTGSTTKEAREVLIKNGFVDVKVFTLAH
jgi:competence protein ComFC